MNIEIKDFYLTTRDYFLNSMLLYVEMYIFLIVFLGFHWSFVIISFLRLLFLKKSLQSLKNKRRSRILYLLGDYLYYVKVLMLAGKTIEHSWISAYEQCVWGVNYSDRLLRTLIEDSIKDLTLGVDINSVLRQLDSVIQQRVFSDFVLCAESALKKGDTVVELLEMVSQSIRDQSEMEMEIKTIMSGSRFELSVLRYMPIFIIMAVRYMAPGYLSVNYESVLGVLVMSISLLLILVSQGIASRIYEGIKA